MNFIIYIAESIDGYIADSNGKVDWLSNFQTIDCEYEDFIKDIDSIVMGRVTYEQVIGFEGEYPYKNKKSYVLTSKTFENDNKASFYSDANSIIDELKEQNCKNVWIMGGAKTCSSFLNMKLIDTLDLFIIPTFLNNGIKLFNDIKVDVNMELIATKNYDNKISRLTYKLSY